MTTDHDAGDHDAGDHDAGNLAADDHAGHGHAAVAGAAVDAAAAAAGADAALGDSAGVPWAGRNLQANPFSGDDGAAVPELVEALAAFAVQETTTTMEGVVAALATSRVLIPILAELDVSGEGAHGQEIDKEASAGVVALMSPDGRRALPVFSSVATMAAWRTDARPVPSMANRAALSAVQEDWSLLVVDPGGPITALVPRPGVWALAQGKTWQPAVRDGVIDEEVREAVKSAVLAGQHVKRADAEPGRTAEVAVVLGLDAGLDRAGLDKVLEWVNRGLAASSVLSERVDSLELRIGKA